MKGAPITVPRAMEDVAIRRSVLEDLALKILYLTGELSLRELGEHMRLSTGIVEKLFQRLRKEQLCEVTGMEVAGGHRIVTTSQGKARAQELLALNQYAGPAPVSLKDYVARVQAQSVKQVDVHPPDVRRAFAHLVLGPDTLTQLGAAIVSGRSIFLYGPTGTGKTSVAETFSRLFHNDEVWIPHAVEVDGQIITVFDPGVHEKIEAPASHGNDARWVLCRRPHVMVGGELTIEMLDLQFNPAIKYYVGPVQMKANNGLLIIDDFGRQRMHPEELLNRWVVPLDRRIDFLTLAGGRKIEIPFDVFVVFATNLDVGKLVDEAFLRRIQTKVKLDCITREHFHEIFRRVCNQARLAYDVGVVDSLIQMILTEFHQPLRPCHPGDIVQQICWAARYQGKEPQLDLASVVQACRNYFVTA